MVFYFKIYCNLIIYFKISYNTGGGNLSSTRNKSRFPHTKYVFNILRSLPILENKIFFCHTLLCTGFNPGSAVGISPGDPGKYLVC